MNKELYDIGLSLNNTLGNYNSLALSVFGTTPDVDAAGGMLSLLSVMEARIKSLQNTIVTTMLQQL
jgi:hypothetical protein